MIKNETYFSQNLVVQITGNIVSDMGGEKVMISIDNGKYYNFGEIGGRYLDINRGVNISKSIGNSVNDI